MVRRVVDADASAALVDAGIVAQIDAAQIARERRVLATLRIRDSLLAVIRGNDPKALSADLPIEQIGEVQHVLEL
jgi:parvulin-like peptidyl-prolyl isomerase